VHPAQGEEPFGAEASALIKELVSGSVIEPVISMYYDASIRGFVVRELWLNGFTIGEGIHK